MRLLAISTASLLALALGCNQGSTSEAPARQGTSVPAPTASVTPAATAALLASSSDVDTASLAKQLGCGGARHKEACRIVDEFSGATRWTMQIPSGEGRWVGNVQTVEKGADKADLLVFLARQVPTATVGPTELPLRIGIGSFPDDKRDAALKMVNQLSHGDTVPRQNQALPFVKAWSSGDEHGAILTSGMSVRLVSNKETYVRQGAGQKLLIVSPAQRSVGSPGDGVYAEAWAATW
jgi:hypothetical protein